MRPKPLVLIILDGWGYSPRTEANAIALARKPTYDRLLREYPNTLIHTSGPFVGLPDGQMGNSEVGHLNIGAGRVVYMDITKIDLMIENGELFSNPALVEAMKKARIGDRRLHLFGLLSDGGDFADAEFAHLLLQFTDEVSATVWRGVAAVHEAMDEDLFDFFFFGHFEKSEEVMDVRVHAAIAEQPEEMELALAAALHGFLKQRNLIQGLVGHQQINLGDIHVHDAACSDVHVADFAVAHLSVGQADGRARSLNEGIREILDEPVVGGLLCERYGVALGIRAIATSIQYRQYHRFRSFAHGESA